LANTILQYLGNQKYIEVAGLINGIQQAVAKENLEIKKQEVK
jgi:hypothetical protein